MTLLEFNEICYSLGWEDDIGYSFSWEDDIGYTQPTGPWHQFYNTAARELPDNAEKDYLICVSIDYNIVNPNDEVNEITIEIVDHKKTLDTRKYNLKNLKWNNDTIKSIIKTVSDMFIYIYINSNHLTTGDVQKLVERMKDKIEYTDYDEAEDWYCFINKTSKEYGLICLYTAGISGDYYKPEGVRHAKVIDTFEYDPDNVYNDIKEIYMVINCGGDNHWKCTYKECDDIKEIEKILNIAYEKYKKITSQLS